MINLSHNKNLNFAFLFSYFLIYNLHATTSTLLPEQSPKYPQFTAPLVSKHSDLPQFLTSFLSHPIHCLQLTHAPCIRHFFSIFSFSFFFVIFRKFNVFFLSGLSTLFLFFFPFLICFPQKRLNFVGCKKLRRQNGKSECERYGKADIH